MKTLFLFMIALAPVLPASAQQPLVAKKPKNIILMVGDGMGTAQIFAGLTANHGTLNLTRCTAIGFQKTQSADAFVTDSGAGATAFAIGKKAKNGAIGVDAQEKPQQTILETAKKNGLSTGLVVTCSITHATPASFYAHVPSRSQVEDIAADMLKGNVDVFVGGGRNHFAHRKDGRNLVQELQTKGYQIADSTADLSTIKTGKLAAFTADLEPKKISEGRGDLLLNGTTTALRLLDQTKKGFFMMIEGSQIDWGGHENQTNYIVGEMLDFNKTIGAVLDFAEKDGNTLVVITADHETGGLAITDGDMQAGQAEGKYVTKGHTGIMVPVFAYGPGAEAFIGIYENTAIFDKMMAAYALRIH
ncbi:alkaline phosphatase [Spirosoma sp. HMF4905]|uniref:Alkaline phosphatase n=1 Tax=Spirosoma arboris TaxID=2682092 RepID=A0A7K1S657_9BACT|nr:alkaline phosphatase [Spirosoma arboris]MVM29225.1 alkaline phosphatase [Spirosoma arboris]